MAKTQRVQGHYDKAPEAEWERLERHRTEFQVTLRAFDEYFPAATTHIADIGGGPGRYAIELAKRGYQVTLGDLSPGNVALAKNKAEQAGVTLVECLELNVLDLSQLPDNHFDVVLLMGPLYHLHEETQRQQAIQQALAKLKPGGRFFAAFICRYAPIRAVANLESDWLLTHREAFDEIWKNGTYDGDEFPNSYFAHPTEIAPLMESCGLKTLDLIGVEGCVSMIEDEINKLEGDLWEAWVDVNYQIGKDPSMHGGAEHLLYVGEK
jgi:S-adenosylmethionine-dependent methyltransferase